jgi:hypothetical protein
MTKYSVNKMTIAYYRDERKQILQQFLRGTDPQVIAEATKSDPTYVKDVLLGAHSELKTMAGTENVLVELGLSDVDAQVAHERYKAWFRGWRLEHNKKKWRSLGKYAATVEVIKSGETGQSMTYVYIGGCQITLPENILVGDSGTFFTKGAMISRSVPQERRYRKI